MGRLADKVAIVTGGASGIGKKTAEVFVREGAKVVISDINEEKGQATASELGENAHFMTHNVVKEEDWQRVIKATVEQFGKLDILINNAGLGLLKDIESVTFEEWRFVHSVTLDGVFLGCKYGIEAMKENGGGSIVNISSLAGLRGVPNMISYATAKGGVRMLSKSVALHCAQRGYNIRSNSVHPSFIDTPMVEDMINRSPNPEKTKAFVNNVAPLRRLGHAEEVAQMILYLASDESTFCTGGEFVIDGGITAR